MFKKQTCSLRVHEAKIFCWKYEEEVKKIDNFCGKCSKKQQKAIDIVFIGEPKFNAGGPWRVFFTLYFDATAGYIMQGASSFFTFLSDVKKLNNG